MRSITYWIGFLLIALATLAIYKWPGIVGRPRSEMVLLRYEPLDPEVYTPGAEAEEFRQQLLKLGVQFPEGSTLRWDTRRLGFGFEFANTWAEHRRILRHDPFQQLQIYYGSGMTITDMSYQVGERKYGFFQFTNLEFTRSPDPPRVRTVRKHHSEFFYGAKPLTFATSNHWLGFGFPRNTQVITFDYAIWTMMLFLTLVPYTLLFFLRRPLWRGITGLIRWRKRDSE